MSLLAACARSWSTRTSLMSVTVFSPALVYARPVVAVPLGHRPSLTQAPQVPAGRPQPRSLPSRYRIFDDTTVNSRCKQEFGRNQPFHGAVPGGRRASLDREERVEQVRVVRAVGGERLPRRRIAAARAVAQDERRQVVLAWAPACALEVVPERPGGRGQAIEQVRVAVERLALELRASRDELAEQLHVGRELEGGHEQWSAGRRRLRARRRRFADDSTRPGPGRPRRSARGRTRSRAGPCRSRTSPCPAPAAARSPRRRA